MLVLETRQNWKVCVVRTFTRVQATHIFFNSRIRCSNFNSTFSIWCKLQSQTKWLANAGASCTLILTTSASTWNHFQKSLFPVPTILHCVSYYIKRHEYETLIRTVLCASNLRRDTSTSKTNWTIGWLWGWGGI